MNTPFSRWFGRLIAERRKAAGIRQSELAERFGVDQSTVSKWERGRLVPDLETVLRLEDELGFRLDDLRTAS